MPQCPSIKAGLRRLPPSPSHRGCTVFFDFDQLPEAKRYKLLTATVTPRPIAWVVSCASDGTLNAAPFSFFNAVCADPPTICLGIGTHAGGRDKDTLANLRANGEFVANLVCEADAQAMNVTAATFQAGIDELQRAGVSTTASSRVAPPRITSSPVSLECRVREIMALSPTNHLVIASVVGVHVNDDAVLDADRCWVDTARLQLIGRMDSPGGYVRTRDRFTMRVPEAD